MNPFSRWVTVWENKKGLVSLSRPSVGKAPEELPGWLRLELLNWQWKRHFLIWGSEVRSMEWWGNNLKANINIKKTHIFFNLEFLSLCTDWYSGSDPSPLWDFLCTVTCLAALLTTTWLSPVQWWEQSGYCFSVPSVTR